MVWSGRKGYKRVRSLARSGHLGQFTAWSCQIWQLEEHTLSQRLRCFPTESRAVIFPQRRQYSPLTLPINRISVEDLGGGWFGSKVSQKKPAFSPNFCRFLPLLPMPAASSNPLPLGFWFSSSLQQPATRDNSLSCKAKPGQPPPFPLILFQQSQRNTAPSPSHQHNASNRSSPQLQQPQQRLPRPPQQRQPPQEQASSFQLLHRPTAVLLPPATPSSNRSSSSFLSHTNSSSRELSFSSAGIGSFFFQPGPVHASEATSLHRGTASSTPGALLPPLCASVWFFSCMQNEQRSACRKGGGNNSPRWFLIRLGQIGSGPAIWVSFCGPDWS